MLRRTVSPVLYVTINNRRLFSLTTAFKRQQHKNINEYSTEVNNEHRQFSQFYSRSSNSSSQIRRNKSKKEKAEEELDVNKPQFNRYNVSRIHSTVSTNKKFIEDDENDLFGEEKDDLTMLGTDKKVFSLSTISDKKPNPNVVSSLTKKTET